MIKITLVERQKDSTWQAAGLDAFPTKVEDNAILWIDVNTRNLSESDKNKIQSYFKIKELNFNELVSELEEKGMRSRIEADTDRITCILRYPDIENFLPEGKMERLAVILSSKWIISVHVGDLELIGDIEKRINNNDGFTLSVSPTTDILLYGLLCYVINQYYSASDLLFEKIEELTQVALGFFKKTSQLVSKNYMLEIVTAKRRMISIDQSLNPISDITEKVIQEKYPFLKTDYIPYFDNLEGEIAQLKESFDATSEEISNLSSALLNSQTINTNNIVRILTLISAIFLPLALITGLYGTNFIPSTIPDLQNQYGFFTMLAIMVIIAVTLATIFKRKGWF